MITRKLAATTAILLLHPLVWADASFQSSTQITVGALVNSFKSMPFAPSSVNSMLEPTVTVTVVHGNQKAVMSKERTEIFDIDKETLTRIDSSKKTYTVITFEQMRQMMRDMPQKLAEMPAKMHRAQGQNKPAADYTITSDTKVADPGASKVVNGLLAQERIITVTTTATLTNPPPNAPLTSMTYITTTELWFAPEPPELQEIQDFDVRMYAKLSKGLDMKAIAEQMKAAAANAGLGMMFANKPGASNAMAEMNKEIAKFKGIRVLEITSMTNPGLPVMPAATPGAPAAAPTGSAVAGQVATDTATQTAAGESSKLGIFGSALGNSALSAFRRKKSTPPPAAVPTPAPAGNAAGSGPTADANTMMTTTTQETNFSRDPVPASAFQIPAGYKQVQLPNGMY